MSEVMYAMSVLHVSAQVFGTCVYICKLMFLPESQYFSFFVLPARQHKVFSHVLLTHVYLLFRVVLSMYLPAPCSKYFVCIFPRRVVRTQYYLPAACCMYLVCMSVMEEGVHMCL